MLYTCLFLAKNWPEPNSTAAGRRSLDMLTLLADAGYEVHVASAAEPTPFQHNLTNLGFHTHAIALNHDSFDAFAKQLAPDLVIYDRFVTEEQFGWRVRQTRPEAMTLLDTSDLHCLRKAREVSFKQNTELNLNNETALREVAAIVRCDLTMMISSVEQHLLQAHFGVPSNLLTTLPFLIDDEDIQTGANFEERQHCVMIGGFKHEPNRDATRWLKQSLWPKIRQQLPKGCEMHVYGAYADHAMNQLNQPKENFYIKGRTDDALKTLQRYRLNLAPLRFGAGQKGKILEGWLSGTPTLTNSIGAESMANAAELGYELPESEDEFSALCASVYNDTVRWQTLVGQGQQILRDHFLRSQHANIFTTRVRQVADNLPAHRAQNFWGQMLWQNQFRATEYMSRWIELKNR